MIPYRCAFCQNPGEWMGKPMALELDHINGISNDHRLENLRFLCPNCHATTDTYCGKNIREAKHSQPVNKSQQKKHKPKPKPQHFCAHCGKPLKTTSATLCLSCVNRRVLDRPTPIEIAQTVKEKGFFRGAKDYGVSDNAVRRWCDEYGIPRHTKQLVAWLDDEFKRHLQQF